jgi:hypothetical protein
MLAPGSSAESSFSGGSVQGGTDESVEVSWRVEDVEVPSDSAVCPVPLTGCIADLAPLVLAGVSVRDAGSVTSLKTLTTVGVPDPLVTVAVRPMAAAPLRLNKPRSTARLTEPAPTVRMLAATRAVALRLSTGPP